MNVYIACGLTHVPRTHFARYTAFIHYLAGQLSTTEGHHVRYALVDSDPQLASKPLEDRAKLCYLWDTKMVQEADVVIGECSFPAIGLGIELQAAAAQEIPIILAFRDFSNNCAEPVRYHIPDCTEHDLQIGDGFVSLMALGVPTVMKVHRYTTDQDGVEQLRQSLRLVQH